LSEIESLIGSYVTLLKLTSKDSQFCVSLRNSNQGKFLTSGSKTIEEQDKWLIERPDNEINYLILDKNKVKIGVISLIGIDMINKRAEPARFIMLPEMSRRNSKLIFEPLFLIYQLAFEYLDLNRIYGIIAASNVRMIKLQQHLGMEIEGVMREHIFINNKFEDVLMVSLLKKHYLNYSRNLFLSILS